jgi:acylphosphatase
MPRKPVLVARRYVVRGRVQGVGYRYFAQHHADRLGVRGYVRNLDNGSVEVYAVATEDRVSDFAGCLHQGPRWSDVRGVEEQEAAVQQYGSFRIEA